MSDGPEVLLGIDVGGTKVGVALATLDGTVLARRQNPTHAADGAEQVVRRAGEAARALVADHGAYVVAVGAVSPGVPRPDGVLLAPTIDGWADLRFADAVRDALATQTHADVPVVVGNDVKAGALAEHRTGALAGARTGVYLNLGTGIALAVVVDGVVLTGAHGAAGEVAYQHTAPGQPGALDDRAPLEELVGGRVVDATATRVVGRPTTAVEALRSTDDALRAAVEPALAALDVALVNACCLLDPDVVVVAGGLMGAADVLLPRLQRAVDHGAPLAPTVVAARHTFDAPLVGALLLAAEAHGDRPTRPPHRPATKELA